MRRIGLICIVTVALLLGFAITGYASEDSQEATELSLEEAIEKALNNCFEIEMAEMDVDKAWEERETARGGHINNLMATQTEVSDLYIEVPAAGEPFFSYLAAHGQWRITRESLEMTRDMMVLQAMNNYYEIIKNKEEMETLETELEKAEEDYRTTRAKKAVGMATNMELQRAKSLVEGSKSTLDGKKATLQKNYRDFKKLIGMDRDEEIKLTTPVEFEEIEVPSLESKIARDLSPDNNPYLFTVKEQYEISKYSWTTARSDEAGKIERDKKQLEYQDEREDMRNRMYDMYDNLQSLESTYNSLQESVAAAEEALRVTEQMYEVGMVTKSDVMERKAGLKDMQDRLLDIKIKYALAKEQFEKPWVDVLGSSGGNGSGQASQ